MWMRIYHLQYHKKIFNINGLVTSMARNRNKNNINPQKFGNEKKLQDYRMKKLFELLGKQSKPVKMVPFMHKHYWDFKFPDKRKNIGLFRKFLAILMKRGIVKKTIINGYSYISLTPRKSPDRDTLKRKDRIEKFKQQHGFQKQRQPHSPSPMKQEHLGLRSDHGQHDQLIQPLSVEHQDQLPKSNELISASPSTPSHLETKEPVRKVRRLAVTTTITDTPPISGDQAVEQIQKGDRNTGSVETKLFLYERISSLEHQIEKLEITFQETLARKLDLWKRFDEFQHHIYVYLDQG